MTQFLTRIPIPITLDVTEEDFGKGLAFAPLVGMLIGGLMAAVYYGASYITQGIFPAVAAVIFYAFITGGLHIDGLGDTFDGLFSNRSRDRMLEIMRDSRVGTNAVITIVSVFLLNIACIDAISKEAAFKAVFFMPAIGRLGSVCSAGMATYARSGQGLGKAFIDICGINEIIIGTMISLLAAFTLFNIKGFIFVGAAILFTYLFVKFVTSKIGGMTGDTCGAACELNQTIFLVLMLVLK
jgi:adenosylcobinamide-GDP ribazoletransferase